MLVSNNSNKVLFLKMVSGEEIISYCTKETVDEFVLNKPLLVILSRGDQEDQGYVSFVPWIICADTDSELTIKKSLVITSHSAKTEASSQYINAVGSLPSQTETEKKLINTPVVSRSRH